MYYYSEMKISIPYVSIFLSQTDQDILFISEKNLTSQTKPPEVIEVDLRLSTSYFPRNNLRHEIRNRQELYHF